MERNDKEWLQSRGIVRNRMASTTDSVGISIIDCNSAVRGMRAVANSSQRQRRHQTISSYVETGFE